MLWSHYQSVYSNSERLAPVHKWIFKKNTDADDNVTVYKARLVAKGFQQVQGIDYDETFSPIAMLKSVRIMLEIGAFYDYEIWQMDVKTAFLNGFLEEELYHIQPFLKDIVEEMMFWHSICKIS